MFNKILIANRGEIACRVIKTAKRLGIQTVAVYSEADVNAQHVKLADEAFHIGAAASSQSYLDGEKIIQVARISNAQAIHPGYGFLSENSKFAKACTKNDIVFIGPPSSAIEAMGSKSAAKNIMQKAGVPLVPGYHDDDQSFATLKQAADEMGYPVLLKAVAGGGGKGMRQVWSTDEFEQALSEAKSESLASFANDDMLVEKYLTQPRHIEVQVFCDQRGHGVYLFERDCSIQRRHQKVIEEAPAPNISRDQRVALGNAAVQAARAIDYEGAGTVEFLFDTDGSFYFMEMNTRLQVEHPVTEMITGQDLVEWQLKVANGEPLPLSQDQLSINGHAVETRIYAEDPDNDFLPTTGTLETHRTPIENEYVRVDSGVIEGDVISPFYDPMIAKLIVWDKDRTSALRRTAKALRNYRIHGLTTNINFLYTLVCSKPLVNAELDTSFIEKHSDLLFSDELVLNTDELNKQLCHAGVYLVLSNQISISSDPWSINNAWRMNQTNEHVYQIEINEVIHDTRIEQWESGNEFRVHINDSVFNAQAELNGDQFICTLEGHRQILFVSQGGQQHENEFVIFSDEGATPFVRVKPDLGNNLEQLGQASFLAPMNGTIVDVLVKKNEKVQKDQAVIILEAMKMQHTISAPSEGIVEELFFSKGELVDGGALLLNFIAAESD